MLKKLGNKSEFSDNCEVWDRKLCIHTKKDSVGPALYCNGSIDHVKICKRTRYYYSK